MIKHINKIWVDKTSTRQANVERVPNARMAQSTKKFQNVSSCSFCKIFSEDLFHADSCLHARLLRGAAISFGWRHGVAFLVWKMTIQLCSVLFRGVRDRSAINYSTSIHGNLGKLLCSLLGQRSFAPMPYFPLNNTPPSGKPQIYLCSHVWRCLWG